MSNDVNKTEEMKEKENNSETLSRQDAPPPKPGKGLLLFISLLALAALIGSGLNYINLRKITPHEEIVKPLINQYDVLNQQFTALLNDNKRLNTSIAELKSNYDMLSAGLRSNKNRQKYNDTDRSLSEAEHLLIIAIQRLTLERDVATALVAMKSADDRLKDINEPGLISVRRQLTADVNALESVNTVDISGLALYLADIAIRADKLPLKQAQVKQEKTPEEISPQNNDEAPLWRRLIDKAWEELKGLVIISKQGNEAAFSLLPEQRYYLYQNLRLQLETGRLAVLRRDTETLHTSVNIIKDWLAKYFDPHDAGVASIMTSLEQMHKLELNPALPDISSSLKTVRAYIEDRHDNPPPVGEEENPSP